MNRVIEPSKKIKKARKKPALVRKKYLQKSIPLEDKKRPPRCRFKEIPLPNKFLCPSSIYPLNGDILLMDYYGMLVTELSLFNEFKLCREVIVDEIFGRKVIAIKLIPKANIEPLQWTEFIEKLTIPNPDALEWDHLIKEYAHTYNKVMMRQSRKKLKSGSRKKFFGEVTTETAKQTKLLFESYPCLQMKFRIKNHQNQLKEVVVNQDFVKQLGHSIESFVISVLREGLPQMMPYDNPLAKFVMKPLVENYFTIKDDGYKISDLHTALLIKKGFARDITFKTYFLMNYEANTFGLDMIIAITKSGEPYVLPIPNHCPKVSVDFVDSCSKREKEYDIFLKQHYNTILPKKYTNFSQVCLIRELDSSDDEDESIIVKKYEEEI